eukprot:SAG22_NODE_5907_length_933_cov_0.899281_2_plen_113_part_01
MKNKVIKSQINAEMKRLQQQEEERRSALEAKILAMEEDLAAAASASASAEQAQAIIDEQAAERTKFGRMKAEKIAELDAKFEAKQTAAAAEREEEKAAALQVPTPRRCTCLPA